MIGFVEGRDPSPDTCGKDWFEKYCAKEVILSIISGKDQADCFDKIMPGKLNSGQ